MTNKDNNKIIRIFNMNREIEQGLFNRMSVFDKLTLLDYVSSSKHKIVINEELR